MAIKIKLKNSVTQDAVPTATHLPEVGELAVNANINSIGGYMRASDNTIVKIFGPGSVSTPTASTTVSGIAELATSAETTTGTDTARVTTPAGVKAVTDAERTTSNSTYLAKAGGTLTGVLQVTAGSNSAPAIHFGDSDSGLFGGTNTVSLTAGGTTRLTADTGVSVVGTLAVTGAITSTSDLTIADKIIHSGDTDTAIRFPAANTVSVETGGSERARVDSSGRLLVGLSSSLSNGCLFQVARTNDNAAEVYTYSANTNGPVVTFTKSRNGTLGTNTVVQSGDTLGQISFRGADGTGYIRGASIQAKVDGTPGTDDMPGRLEFSTTADGASSQSTRLTITSAGLVNVPDNGKFTAGASNDLQIYHDSSNGNSFITESGSGSLVIKATNTIINSSADEQMISATADGAVELYHNNAKKFETDSNGITITGTTTCNGDVHFDGNTAGRDALWDRSDNCLHFQDNAYLKIGTGTDLQLYHNGSHSYIKDTGTGDLFICSDDLHIGNAANTEDMAVFKENGAVELYYDNSKKLETHADGVVFAEHAFFGDNDRIKIGTGSDLQLWHTGSESVIENRTGDLGLRAKQDENGIIIKPDGAVELYYDNAKKLETSSTGGILRGTMWTAVDDTKIAFGTGDDLQIYHDGSSSYIDEVGTGSLKIQTNGTGVDIQKGSSETIARFIADGAVELYYDNSKKFETTSGGATVTGTLIATANIEANNNLQLLDNGKLLVGSGNDLQIYHDGTNSIIEDINDSPLWIQTDGAIRLTKDAAAAYYATFNPGGAVDLYYDGSKKFETDANGVTVTGNIYTGGNVNLTADKKIRIGAGEDLQFWHDGTNSYFSNSTGNLYQRTTGNLYLQVNGGSNENAIVAKTNGSVELYYDNAKKFETDASGAKITGRLKLDDNYKVSMGDDADLQIYHDGTNSYIKNTTNDLTIWDDSRIRVRTPSFMVNNQADTENLLVATENGSVDLYFDAVKKLETTSAGVTVTGTVSDSKGDLRSIPQNTQGSAYTLVNSDGGKHILASGNIVWVDGRHSAGDAITIVNNTAGNITITKGTTMYNTADGNNANRTLGTRGMATILWASGTVAYISGSGLT